MELSSLVWDIISELCHSLIDFLFSGASFYEEWAMGQKFRGCKTWIVTPLDPNNFLNSDVLLILLI